MSAPDDPTPPRGLPRTVLALGLVSFLTDASSEMVYPLVPLFLTTVLPGGVAFVGMVEGVAETTAALVKIVSGRLADRLPRQKPLVLFGYGLSALARPFIAVAAAPWHVLAVRFADRVGKGVRGSPRDAIVADVTPASQRGAAYGYHKAMDNAGAVLGPLLALALLGGLHLDRRRTFAWASVPGVFVILFLVREAPRPEAAPKAAAVAPEVAGAAPPSFRLYMLSVGIFTLGNASDAFLLLRAADVLDPGTIGASRGRVARGSVTLVRSPRPEMPVNDTGRAPVSQGEDAAVVPLHLSPVRYGGVAAVLGGLAIGMAYLSTQPTLAKPGMTAKAQAIARLLMSIDRIAGVWPLAAAAAVAFAAPALGLLWALVSRRPFELRMDSQGVTWPSLAPWRGARAFSWSEIETVTINQSGDHLVFATRTGRQLLPAWWLPPDTSPPDVVRTAAALKAQVHR